MLLYNNVDNYLIGDSLLRHYYTVYDIDRYEIGLGKLAAEYDAPYTPHADGIDEDVIDDEVDNEGSNEDVVDPNGDVTGEDPQPTHPDSEDQIPVASPVGKIIVYSIASAGVLALVCMLCCCCCKRKNRDEDERKLAMVDPESSSQITAENTDNDDDDDEYENEDLLG